MAVTYLGDGSIMKGTVYGDGLGEKTLPDGTIFCGKFISNELAEGIVTFPDGSAYLGKFAKTLIQGTMRLPDGSEVCGLFNANGMLDGWGTMKLNGWVIEGFFKEGILNGYGRKIFKGKIIEEGNYMCGILHSIVKRTLLDVAKR